MVKNKYLHFFMIVTLSTIFFDQLLKYLVEKFKPNFNFELLKIHYVTNTGAGFGILQGKTVILTLISFIVAMIVIYYYKQIPKEKFTQLLFALFLGGVIGNFIDRFFRGFVIDFIEFSFWPAFNIADSAITIAVIGIIIKMLNKEF